MADSISATLPISCPEDLHDLAADALPDENEASEDPVLKIVGHRWCRSSLDMLADKNYACSGRLEESRHL